MKQHLEPIPEKTRLRNMPPKEDLQPGTHFTEPSLQYLSNLKAFLTALVILHHTAVFYGGAGHLPYHSSSSPPGSEPVLVAFNAVNQTFFMALFFFIAGFLSRQSLARRTERTVTKGIAGFVKDRLRRLGIPVVVYSIFAPAVCRVAAELGRGREVKAEHFWAEIKGIKGVRGPVWFCALLLIFDILLAATCTFRPRTLAAMDNRSAKRKADFNRPSSVHGPTLLAALALLTTIDFLWRLYFPVGRMFTPLNLNPGYLPQYIAAYIFGVSTPTPGSAIPSTRSLRALAAISLASSALLGRSMSSTFGGEQGKVLRGWNTGAAAYAVWNNSTGYLIGTGLLQCFQCRMNASWERISSLAYLAVLVHIPVSLLICLFSQGWREGPVIKTIIVGSVNIGTSWLVAWAGNACLSQCRQTEGTTPAANIETRAGSAQQRTRHRTLSKGEKALEILEGLDEVGC